MKKSRTQLLIACKELRCNIPHQINVDAPLSKWAKAFDKYEAEVERYINQEREIARSTGSN